MAKREPASPENRRAPEHAKRRKKSQQDAGRRQEDGKRRVREDQSSKRAQNRARMEEEARLERMRAQNRKGKGGEDVYKRQVWSFELCDRTAIFMMCTTLREDFGTILFCSFYFDKDMLYYF